jgi:hypothetical protein
MYSPNLLIDIFSRPAVNKPTSHTPRILVLIFAQTSPFGPRRIVES